jgi:ABC-type transporter Mla subunit MlaD
MDPEQHDGDRPRPPKNSGRRTLVVVVALVLLAFVVVFGYILLVGTNAGR